MWRRTISIYPPIVEDRSKLKEYIKLLHPNPLENEVVDDIVDTFGGSLLSYRKLLLRKENIKDNLYLMKKRHTEDLMSVLDLNEGQTFSVLSMERYKLLKAVERGEKFISESPTAYYLLEKHGDIEPFLGIHPKNILFLLYR